MDLNDNRVRRDWIAQHVAGPNPPIYRLAFPEHIDAENTRLIGTPQPSTSRHPDSGILQLWLPGRTLGPDDPSRVSQQILAVALAEDERVLVAVATGSEVVVAEWESRIPDRDMPVIGPGGRIVVAREATGLVADLIIRKRLSEIWSRWRAIDAVMEGIDQQIARRATAAPDIVEAAFGYLELSRHERQDWLRPVFLLSMVMSIPGDERLRWVETIAEPATEAPEIGPADGLGSWFG